MKSWWSLRTHRERRLLWIALVLGILIPTSTLLLTIVEDTRATEARLTDKRRWIAAYRAQPIPLRGLRDDQRLAEALRAAGVAPDRFSLSSNGSGGWQLTLRGAPFDAVITALDRSGPPGPAVRMQLVAAGPGRVDGSLEFAPAF